MVAYSTFGLVFRDRSWKAERTPVCEAADDAASAKNLKASHAGDSGEKVRDPAERLLKVYSWVKRGRLMAS